MDVLLYHVSNVEARDNMETRLSTRPALLQSPRWRGHRISRNCNACCYLRRAPSYIYHESTLALATVSGFTTITMATQIQKIGSFLLLCSATALASPISTHTYPKSSIGRDITKGMSGGLNQLPIVDLGYVSISLTSVIYYKC